MEEKVLVHKLPKFKKEEDKIAHVRALMKSLILDMNEGKPSLFTEYEFKNRSEVETNEDYIQINYGIMLCQIAYDQTFIFTNKKIEKSTEKRLLNKLNVFIGGHTNTQDKENCENPTDIISILKANRDREFAEEVEIVGANYEDLKLIKTDFIYVTDEEVSKHHACLYDVLLVPENACVRIKEEEKLIGAFISNDILQKHQALDNWSAYALK